MAEANRDEVDKCKQIAANAMSAGDFGKATRFLEKARRMSPGDSDLDAMLREAQAGAAGGGGSGEAPPPDRSESSSSFRSSPPQAPPSSGPRQRAHAASGATRTNAAGDTYTADQMKEVQRILRTRDYYDILGVPKDSDEDVVKKAYRKMALKLHPDKNKAPGAEEAFKKVSKAVQCLTDSKKKEVYDRYGDEDHIPHHHRQAYQQDFMTAEDLFSAFFGGGFVHHPHAHHHHRHHHHDPDEVQGQRAHLFQILPVILLVFLTLASNFASRDHGSRFSFTPTGHYQNERSTATLGVSFYVTNDFDEAYHEGTKALAEFERQVEIYYVRQLHSECDHQEKVLYKKAMIAQRHGGKEELQKARNSPRPACKELEKIKKKHNAIWRGAVYMGSF